MPKSPTKTRPEPLPEGSLLAAIDIGSNSFHLILAKVEHGEMRPVETLGEKVQLGAGLRNGVLSQDAIERGLDCLSRFAQVLASVEPSKIRAVGTNALRVARNRRDFTWPASRILGTDIDVIYGAEEARLVYLGVAHTLADDAHSRLVVDIGGGSTEFIVGQRFEPQHLESLQMGCVSYSNQFFKKGKITKARFEKAYRQGRMETSPLVQHFSANEWEESVGSSGTLQAIEQILLLQGWSDAGITRDGLAQLKKTLIEAGTFDNIKLEGLSDQRRNVITAGVAITCALFDELGVEHMRTSRGALREGVIYDLMGRLRHEDVRERTISALTERYSADADTANIVERLARKLYSACKKDWNLSKTDWKHLHWASRTHEIGMAISHKHFNRHGAYLLRNADLPGFSQQEQERLAVLVAAHRGKFKKIVFADIAQSERHHLTRLLTIMRLATLLKYVDRSRQLPSFDVSVKAQNNSLNLRFPDGWLAQHPLTLQALEQERTLLKRWGVTLKFKEKS